MLEEYREGVLVDPYERLTAQQVQWLDRASERILEEPGIWCHNARAAELFKANGARVRETKEGERILWRVSFPPGLVKEAVSMAPSKVVLGAGAPENRLLLDAEVPRAYFGSGSEANSWLDMDFDTFVSRRDPEVSIKAPVFHEKRGSVDLLGRAARLCDQLEHLDFFIRPVNIQDPEINSENHDVNKFFASLKNISKHVQAGLTSLDKLPDVIRMGEIVAGGADALRANPVFSFIACVFKSPLTLVADTADKVFAIVEEGMPVVISSSPQGGSTAPIQEAGIVAQINAEILSGIALTQWIREGAPVLYGSVPVRSRLDDLHDLYGCPEFNQYNMDCVQMARHYRIPCYSSAGVGDAMVPGMQATFEKLFTQLYVSMSGAQYIHYTFGLLNRSNTFCPVQAVLDNEQIGKIKHCMRKPKIDPDTLEDMHKIINKVMASPHRLFTRHVRKALHSGDVSDPYRFESRSMEDRVLELAWELTARLEENTAPVLEKEKIDRIIAEIPGLLPALGEAA